MPSKSVTPAKSAELPKPGDWTSKAIFLLVLAFVVYLPALNGGFLWDDDVLITDNPLIHEANGLKNIWFSTQSPDYFPLTLSMLWLEWRLWGMQTLGYHIVNVSLHALGVVLLWRVLRRLRIPGSFVAAALFAVHPVAVASVAWIAERKNTLSLVFFLLAALWYFRSEDERPATPPVDSPPEPQPSRINSNTWYGLSLFAFLLALLSKTSVVMLPVVFLLCAWWRHSSPAGATKGNSPFPGLTKLMIRLAPFFLLSLILGLVTVWFQSHRAIGVKNADTLERLLGGGWAAWFYLGKALLPTDLSMIYPRWPVKTGSFTAWLPWIAWVGLFGILWKFRRTWGRPLLFALGYFFFTLLPVLGFFDMSFFTYAQAADHLQYLSLIGIVALIGAAIYTPAKGRSLAPSWATPTAIALIIVGAVSTWKHAQTFASSEKLWRHTLKKNPKAWVAYNNLGEALASDDSLEEAVSLFRTAVSINPKYAEAWNNLGSALNTADLLDESVEAFKKSLEARPDFAFAENNWGLALAQRNRLEEALPHFENAVKLSPEFSGAHYNLALTYERQKKTEKAIEHYEAALHHRADYTQARLNLALLLTERDEFEKAAAQLQEGLKHEPDSAEIHDAMGTIMLKKRDFAQAAKLFSDAVRLDPENLSASSNLGHALTKQGKLDEAIEQFRRALALAPEDPEVHARIAAALLEQRKFEQALQHCEISLNGNPRNATVHFQAGVAFARMGRRGEATMAFKEALRLRPTYVEARQQLDSLGR